MSTARDRFETVGLASPDEISRLKFQIEEFKFQIAEFKSQIAELEAARDRLKAKPDRAMLGTVGRSCWDCEHSRDRDGTWVVWCSALHVRTFPRSAQTCVCFSQQDFNDPLQF
jgi:hypothetical protein